jgi:hypothetical protein
VALPLALEAGYSEDQITQLKVLGETLNYNGYGEEASDLAVWPVDCAAELKGYSDPWEYVARSPLFEKILKQKKSDEEALGQVEILHLSTAGEICLMPRGAFSRRMSGIYSNDRVYLEPDLAHATLTHLENEAGYRVSIRAPKNRMRGADELAQRFPTGGGRAGAAGVNVLGEAKLVEFFDAFDEVFSC